MSRSAFALIVSFMGFFFVASAVAEEGAPTIKEWLVPWEESRPRDPYVGPAGFVWFVGQRGDYVGRFNPVDAAFKQFPLEQGAGPHNVIVGSDGTVWYAGNRAAHIGELDPKTGAIHKIPMPGESTRDPHTMDFDEKGNIWFTAQGGNAIGKLHIESQKLDVIDVPTPGARPYGIKVRGDTVWVVLFGTNKLAKVNAADMSLEEIELPRAEARPRRLEVSSKGEVWYVDYVKGKLGRYTPENKGFSEWDMPSGERSLPYGTAMDNQDRIWIVETGVQPNRLVGFDTTTNTFLPGSDIESGAGAVRHMYYHEAKNHVWFGTDANTIGRVELP